MLFLICGLPGSGKTTLGKALAIKTNSVYISSDRVRRQIIKERTYTKKEKFFIYEKMLEKAEEEIKRGKSVVLDATFYLNALREKARLLGEKNSTTTIVIECVLSEEKIRERILKRKKDESEADFNIYLKVKKEFEPVKEKHLTVDCSKPLQKQLDEVLKYTKKFIPSYIDTHISKIYFSDGFVYKVKKEVKFSFLDFSTLGLRKYYCKEEVRLNRRLCPDVYLGVVKAEKHFGGYIFESRSADEYAVKMKKLPMEKQMDKLLEKNKIKQKTIKNIAALIADFHKRIKVIRNERYGNPSLIQKQINDLANHRKTIEEAIGAGQLVDFALQKCKNFNEKNIELFKKRQREGFIRECHGDLHAANIIIDKKIYIFDCIEFNKDFRFIDVASEIAFIAMDLDRFGKRNFSDFFVKSYVAITKDKELPAILDYYKCYRANVRLKVAAIEYAQQKDDKIKEKMRKYAYLMENYAQAL